MQKSKMAGEALQITVERKEAKSKGVEEKKTRAARERETRGGGDDRRDIRRSDRGPGGPRGIVGGGMMRDRDGRGPPPRGGMAQKLGSGRGAGQMEGRFTGQRR